MNYLDISTYIIQNMAGAFGGLVIAIFLTLFLIACTTKGPNEVTKVHLISGSILCLMFSSVAFIPTHDKILKVKLSKIKNELVVEENITKTKGELVRIIKNLECKYLDCKENYND